MDDPWIQALVEDLETSHVFLCKTDALAFLQRLGEAREKLLTMSGSPRIQELLRRMAKVEAEIEAMIDLLD